MYPRSLNHLCKHFASLTRSLVLIVREGVPIFALQRGQKIIGPDEYHVTLWAAVFNGRARELYKNGMTSLEILMSSLIELGCSDCPLRDMCELMDGREEDISDD